MMNFWTILGALIAANAIWTIVGIALLKSKVIQKWYMNWCKDFADDMVDFMDEE